LSFALVRYQDVTVWCCADQYMHYCLQ